MEEGTVNTIDQSGGLREADLTGHLSNPKDSEAPAKRVVDESKDKASDKADDKKTDDKKPTEPGSKNDYQFNQALNLLKGLQILQQK